MAKVVTTTLTADTVASLALVGSGRTVELVHHGDADVAVYVDFGANPTVAGDDCDVLLPGERVQFASNKGTADCRVISSGIPTVTARRVS